MHTAAEVAVQVDSVVEVLDLEASSLDGPVPEGSGLSGSDVSGAGPSGGISGRIGGKGETGAHIPE